MFNLLFFHFQHGTSWRRRSLIEDAKFDTVTNAEFERTERPVSISEADDDVFTSPVTNGDVNHVIYDAEKAGEQRRCTLMLSLQDASSMSKIFRTFEVSFSLSFMTD